jgi:hypothetical protein
MGTARENQKTYLKKISLIRSIAVNTVPKGAEVEILRYAA